MTIQQIIEAIDGEEDDDKEPVTGLGDAADDEDEELEVEIDGEEEADPEAADKDKPAGGRKSTVQRTIDRKTKEATEADENSQRAYEAVEQQRTRAEEFAARNAELANKLAKEQEGRQAADEAAAMQMARAAKSDLAIAQRDLEAAHVAVDPVKIAEATARMGKAQGEIQQAEGWVSDQKRARAARVAEAAEEARNPKPTAIPDGVFTVGQWQGQNEWANPVSEKYDDSKFTEVEKFGAKLNAAFKAQGRGADIGTLAYWQRINRFAVDYDKRGTSAARPGNRIPEMKGGEAALAGAGDGGNGAKPNERGKQSVRLTPADMRMVASYEGVMTDEKGVNLTKEQIIKVIAKGKLKQQEDDKKNRRTA